MASKDEARRKAIAAVNAIFERYRLIVKQRPDGHVDFDHGVMKDLKLLDAGPEGSTLYEIRIDEKYSNLNNIMHGGATATIFDMSTMSALGPLQRPGYWYFMGGITRALNVSYLRAVPIGTTIRVRNWVVQHGRTMAMIRGEMFSGGDGKGVYAVAEHHKVHLPTRAEHLSVRLKWDDDIEAQARAEEEQKTKARI
ncbi:thioesterase family protein-like protein [Rhizodiscina lignyota]|uniref:Thioesterase family protein-like protein n=1 Tax=Rhizodiscina lignyota TaxID=1504668 RepID=A0A9P4I8V8_9PEZI|nr:thioesterase family protein-like protein [Rhizodiscina lignyota]